MRGGLREKRVHLRRSARARHIDEALHAEPPQNLEEWRKNPNQYDLINIDERRLVKVRVAKGHHLKRDQYDVSRHEPKREGEKTLESGMHMANLERQISRSVHGDALDKIDWRGSIDRRLEGGEMLSILRERHSEAFKHDERGERPEKPAEEKPRYSNRELNSMYTSYVQSSNQPAAPVKESREERIAQLKAILAASRR